MWACIFLVPLLLAGMAAGREIYVNNVAGDDRFTGYQPQNLPDRTGPLRTITRALQLAASGDRIVLAKTDQPYRESISLVGSRLSGQPFQPFSIDGNGAVLDGSAPIPPEAWQHFRGAVFRCRPPRMGHQQLFIDDRPAIRVAANLLSDAPPALGPLEWCFHNGHVYFCVQPGKLPEDYRLTCAWLQTGITLFHVAQVGIVNLTVQGFQLDGINAYNSAREVYLAGVTCRGNGRSGITVGGAARVAIDGCLAGNNGQAQLLTLPYGRTDVRNSELLSNTAPAWADRGGVVYLNGQRAEGSVDKRDVQPGRSAGG
jgi:hypothetical protein